MKQIIVLFLLFISNCYSQNLVQYKFDENSFTINIPEGYEKIDVSGQHFVKSIIGDNILLISKTIEENPVKIINDSTLIKFYDGVKEGILNSGNGESIESKIIKIKKTKFLKLKYKALVLEQPKIFDCLIVTLNDFTYSIIFIYSEEENKNITEIKNKIISSLVFK